MRPEVVERAANFGAVSAAAEQPRFQIEQGPKWLRIDELTGRLSGKPDDLGQADVIIAVTLQRQQRNLDPGQLQWGIEKVMDTRLESVGTAKQAFIIETAQ